MVHISIAHTPLECKLEMNITTTGFHDMHHGRQPGLQIFSYSVAGRFPTHYKPLLENIGQ